MAILKQNVSYKRTFLMVESADHVTGLTGATVTVALSKNGGSFATAAGSVTEIGNGLYYIALTSIDTNTSGDLAFHCTATSGDPTDFVDQVQAQVFTDLQLNASGRALIANNLQQDTALNGFVFPMTSASTGALMTGLTVTAQRTLGSGGFSPCANSVTEIGGGFYTINLASTDLNAATVGLLFTASGANSLPVPLIPTP